MRSLKKLSRLQERAIEVASFVILSPLIFDPLRFCPFSLPFFCCPVCHIRCVRGRFRLLILLGVILLNLKRRFYCARLCPCGTLQDWLSRLKVARIRIPSWTKVIKYLVFIAIVSVLVFIDRFLKFAVYGKLLVYGVVFIFFLSLLIPRFLCRFFCPVDTILEIASKSKKK